MFDNVWWLGGKILKKGRAQETSWSSLLLSSCSALSRICKSHSETIIGYYRIKSIFFKVSLLYEHSLLFQGVMKYAWVLVRTINTRSLLVHKKKLKTLFTKLPSFRMDVPRLVLLLLRVTDDYWSGRLWAGYGRITVDYDTVLWGLGLPTLSRTRRLEMRNITR